MLSSGECSAEHLCWLHVVNDLLDTLRYTYRESSGHGCTRLSCVIALRHWLHCVERPIPSCHCCRVPTLLRATLALLLDAIRRRSLHAGPAPRAVANCTAGLFDDSCLTVAQSACARTSSRAARMCAPTIAGAIVASDITPLMTADRGLAEISETLEKSLQAWTANDGWGKSCQYH